MNDQDMFRINDLDGDEVVVEASAGEKEEHSEKVAKKEVSTGDPFTTTDKGKAKMVEPERPLKRKEQIMMDEQFARDLEAQMQADLEEEQRIAKKKEEEDNMAMIAKWDNT
uniref:Uncharacterized protein n=1 Tax=Tanacetum cinerariifolium TaxID=118510 RepID=A0A699K930_TANCI|nr:hypothetical protein [Tanacetum cinerariifolium]